MLIKTVTCFSTVFLRIWCCPDRWCDVSVCEWILELELLKIHLRILSEWFAKHLEISLGAIPRGFESLPLRQMDKDRSIEQFSWTVQYSYPRFMGESLAISGVLFSHVWLAHFIAKMKVASLIVEKRKIPDSEPFVQISLSSLFFVHGAIRTHPVFCSWVCCERALCYKILS